MTLPYKLKVRYSNLPIRVQVESNKNVYRPFSITGGGGDYYLSNWLIGLGAGTMAISVPLFAAGDAMAIVLGATSALCGVVWPVVGIAEAIKEPKPYLDQEIFKLNQANYRTMDKDEIKTLQKMIEISDIYALLNEGKYDLSKSKTNYMISKAKKERDIYRIGELYYLRGACNYYLKKYKKSISDLEKALSYGDVTNSELNGNAKEFLQLAHKEQDAKRDRIMAGIGSALLAASAGILAASIQQQGIQTNGNNSDYNAWMQYRQSGLPGASTISFEDFKKANARAAANGYQIGGGNSSSNNSSNQTSSQKKCNYCNGTGKIVDNNATTTFGLTDATKYCNDCKKYVSLSHGHVKCPSCNGRGYSR